MLFWIFMMAILVYAGFLGDPYPVPMKGGALSPRLRARSATYYHDLYDKKFHRYPFDFYTLYGYDDYYPAYRRTWGVKYPTDAELDESWAVIKARRRIGKPYIGMPSYNYVRQLGNLEA